MKIAKQAKFKKAVVLALILVIFLEIAALINSKNNLLKSEKRGQKSSAISQHNQEEYKKWSMRVDQVGAHEAYEDFKISYKRDDPGKVHDLAHVFGQVIFDKVGLEGAGVCDDSFAFGCYHSFLGHAIYDQGLEVVTLLNQKCIENLAEQALGCQHGIGHGLVTYLGYGDENLKEALNVCDKLPVADPIGGCLGGVFMEYNFQTMLSSQSVVRDYSFESRFQPCDSIEKKFGPSCYYWQSQWWANKLGSNYEQVYFKMGQFCQELSDEGERQQCFMGTGNVIGFFSDWEVDKGIGLCHLLAEFGGEFGCRIGAVGAFFAEPTRRAVASKFCDGIVGELKITCLKKSRSIPTDES